MGLFRNRVTGHVSFIRYPLSLKKEKEKEKKHNITIIIHK